MSAELRYFPLSKYESGKTNIKRPREVAYFSYDESHKLHILSEASLKYYYPPLFGAPGENDGSFAIHLGQGFESFSKHDDSIDEHLDSLLDTLQAKESQDGAKIEADIVTWRGMMTKILTAPYDRFDGFEMNAVLFQGTIFIEENHSHKRAGEKKQWQPRPGQPSSEEMQYWGYKFETLSTLRQRVVESSREEIEARDRQVVDNEEQYCSIVRTGIGDTILILAGEVDAVLGEKPDDPEDAIPWIELKTTKEIENQKDANKYEDKLLKFWAQSFLLGVPHVVVGFRDMHGRLLRIEQLATNKIPNLAKQMAAREGRSTWNGNLCINFAADVLGFLRQHITTENEVWRISHRSRSGIISIHRDSSVDPATIVKPSFKAHRESIKGIS